MSDPVYGRSCPDNKAEGLSYLSVFWRKYFYPLLNSRYDVQEYLDANGTSLPVFGHGDTLEEAAEAAGVDAETLVKTVELYNSYVEAGEDADFGRSAEYMTMPIGEGPYYIVEQKPRFATTLGGLVIDTDLYVLNKDGEIIKGLFASGEVVGGVMGDDSPSGANNGWAVTSGKLAAQSIAAELGIEAEEDEAWLSRKPSLTAAALLPWQGA